jgi:hypothetical protein
VREGALGGRLAVLALLAGCAAGKFHGEADLDGFVVREGMPAATLTEALGPPEFVSGTGHRFAYEFRDEGRAIDPSWAEWVWFREPKTYVIYVAVDEVRLVGIITDSPPPPRSDDFGTFMYGPCD